MASDSWMIFFLHHSSSMFVMLFLGNANRLFRPSWFPWKPGKKIIICFFSSDGKLSPKKEPDISFPAFRKKKTLLFFLKSPFFCRNSDKSIPPLFFQSLYVLFKKPLFDICPGKRKEKVMCVIRTNV